MKNPSRLSVKQIREVETLMHPEHRVQKAFNRLVRSFEHSFNGDTADIRSICNDAVLRAVQAYSGKKTRKVCNCGEPACSALVRASVRIARNNILNALEARNAQKRGGNAVHVDIDEEWQPRSAESRTEAIETGVAMPVTSWSVEKAIDAFRLGSPLQRVINLQIASRIKSAHRRLTVPQSALLRLALDPTSRVLSRARDLERTGAKEPFLRAAQEAVKGTDYDRLAVEGVVREILSP